MSYQGPADARAVVLRWRRTRTTLCEDGRVALGRAVEQGTFLEQLLAAVPEVGPEVREHLDDNGELLLHVLMPDLLRTATRLFHAGESEVEGRLLAFIDLALRCGDDACRNAVQVSFVEHAGAFPEETAEFLASWPSALKAELRRSRVA